MGCLGFDEVVLHLIISGPFIVTNFGYTVVVGEVAGVVAWLVG